MGLRNWLKLKFGKAETGNRRYQIVEDKNQGPTPPKDIIAGFKSMYQVFVNNRVFDPAFELKQNPKIYDVMLRDAHLYSALRTRQEFTAGLPWKIVINEDDPDRGRQKNAEGFLTRAIKRLPNFEEYVINIQDALLRGMSVQELEWKYDNETDFYLVGRLIPRNKDQFVYTLDGDLKLKTKDSPIFGEDIVDEEGKENSADRFIIHTFDMSPGSFDEPEEFGHLFYGRGLGNVLYWPIFFKTNALQLWMRWVDRYGIPPRTATFPANNTQYRDLMLNILEKTKSDSNMVFPVDEEGLLGNVKEMEVDSGRFDIFRSLIAEYINREISKAVLGETLTQEQGTVGSLALGQVHENVLLQKIDFDQRSVASTLTRTLLRLLLKFNRDKFPGIEKYPLEFQFILDKKIERDARINELKEAIELGLPVGEAFAYSVFNLPMPKKGEKLLEKKEEGFSLKGMDEEYLQELERNEKMMRLIAG